MKGSNVFFAAIYIFPCKVRRSFRPSDIDDTFVVAMVFELRLIEM